MLYAHNSGKFDSLLLMNEVILETDRFKIDTKECTGCIELNSRYLNITLISDDGYKIHCRDSYALLNGKLYDLCEDFKTEHRKLKELVKHDDMGLYEVLYKFNIEVWNITNIVEYDELKVIPNNIKLCGFQSRKKRININVDGYKRNIYLYNYIDSLKTCIEIKSKYDDEIKKKECQKRKIKFYSIPYTYLIDNKKFDVESIDKAIKLILKTHKNIYVIIIIIVPPVISQGCISGGSSTEVRHRIQASPFCAP